MLLYHMPFYQLLLQPSLSTIKGDSEAIESRLSIFKLQFNAYNTHCQLKTEAQHKRPHEPILSNTCTISSATAD